MWQTIILFVPIRFELNLPEYNFWSRDKFRTSSVIIWINLGPDWKAFAQQRKSSIVFNLRRANQSWCQNNYNLENLLLEKVLYCFEYAQGCHGS